VPKNKIWEKLTKELYIMYNMNLKLIKNNTNICITYIQWWKLIGLNKGGLHSYTYNELLNIYEKALELVTCKMFEKSQDKNLQRVM
jgi:hypothetical protein